MGLTKEGEYFLVDRALEGDQDAFKIIVEELTPRVRNVMTNVLYKCASHEDVEDAMQDFFIRLPHVLKLWRRTCKLGTYIHRCVVNHGRMELRKIGPGGSKGRDLLVSLGEASMTAKKNGEDDLTIESRLGCTDDNFFEFDCDELVELIRKRLQPRASGYWLVFFLHDVQQYHHHEIAEMLGIRIGTCKSQLHKARAIVKRLLDENGIKRTRRSVAMRLPSRQLTVHALM